MRRTTLSCVNVCSGFSSKDSRRSLVGEVYQACQRDYSWRTCWRLRSTSLNVKTIPSTVAPSTVRRKSRWRRSFTRIWSWSTATRRRKRCASLKPRWSPKDVRWSPYRTQDKLNQSSAMRWVRRCSHWMRRSCISSSQARSSVVKMKGRMCRACSQNSSQARSSTARLTRNYSMRSYPRTSSSMRRTHSREIIYYNAFMREFNAGLSSSICRN